MHPSYTEYVTHQLQVSELTVPQQVMSVVGPCAESEIRVPARNQQKHPWSCTYDAERPTQQCQVPSDSGKPACSVVVSLTV